MNRRIAGRLTGRVVKWFVVSAWILVAIVGAALSADLPGVVDNQTSSWLPDNAESTKALSKLEAFQDQNNLPTTVVYENRAGLTPEDIAAARSDAREVADLEGAERVTGPEPSRDGQVMQTLVTFNFGKDGWNKMPDARDAVLKIAKREGVSVYVAGQGGQAADSAEAFGGIDGLLLGATLLIVILILLVTYRSPILWILPILSAVFALMTAEGVVYLLAKYADLTVNSQSQGILTVLVIGAATDYALLLVARYREELRLHEDRHEAMAFALHRASPAILASGGTVVLGMLCLAFAEMNATSGLGPVLAVGIVAALASMTTFLPALLVIFGRWMFWPKRPTLASAEPTASGYWARVGLRISRRPRAIWIATAAVLAIACLGMVKLDPNGLSTEDSYTKTFDSVTGQKVLTAHGMADQSSPLLVVARSNSAHAVVNVLTGVQGLGEPSRPFVKGGTALVSAPLTSDATSPAAFDAVKDARRAVHSVPGADALVGGSTAFLTDADNANHRDNNVIIPAVLVVVLLILMLLLRSVLAPILLVATVVLSFGAALGISALLFRYVFDFAGEDASFPLFVFVFLVALGIDYNIFLMTRVREETQRYGTRRASLVALSATGGVITSAGIVLAATFAVLGSLPLVFMTELGVAVALGVLLDTIVVRSILVTALNLDLGSRIWWPSSLDRTADLSEAQRQAAPTPVG